jgi:PKD repeat protein
VAATIGLALLVLTAPSALAKPSNDDFIHATAITSLPFSTAQDTSQATFDPRDPSGCGNNGSVWFAFTPPANMTIQADTWNSDYNTVLSAWTGTRDALNLVACNDDWVAPFSRVTFQATGGTTYYFMVANCCGDGGNGGGNLQLSVRQILPPANDNFANATRISSLPFENAIDHTAATTEPSEPSPSCVGLQNTAWYVFTPTTTESIRATVDVFGAGLGVYTGTSLADLAEVGCGQNLEGVVTFRAQANTTYYFQVGAYCCEVGRVNFALDVALQPTAAFAFLPRDPSSFDTVQFQDTSSDPGGGGIASRAWDLGDGTTSIDCCPTHQYSQDGDYTVQLTVTTVDGRTASTSKVVAVRTHDVAVVKVEAPKTARVGKAITITTHVRNTRYPETVQVDLFKTVPGGFEQVGSLTQSVPVRPSNQTTQFAMAYTVSQADKTAGQFTFKAVATIVGYRDALPSNNDLISSPVKIT